MTKWAKPPKTYGGDQDNLAYEKSLNSPSKKRDNIKNIHLIGTKLLNWVASISLIMVICGFICIPFSYSYASIVGFIGSIVFITSIISYMCFTTIMGFLYYR